MAEKRKKITKKAWSLMKEIEERKTVIGVILTIIFVSFSFIYNSKNTSDSSVVEKKNQQNENQGNNPGERINGVHVEKCGFSDLNNWLGIENFEIEQGNVFKPILSKNFPRGREMFCNQKIGMNFSLPFKFTPLNENKINFSINYGYLWRIIIGNNDYKQVRVQINSKYLSEDKEKAEWNDLENRKGIFWIKPRGLMPLKQVKLNVISKLSDVKDKRVNVSVRISGVSAYDGTDYESLPFSVDLSLPKDKKDFSENVGIGILDTEKEGVKIQLEELKLQELEGLN